MDRLSVVLVSGVVSVGVVLSIVSVGLLDAMQLTAMQQDQLGGNQARMDELQREIDSLTFQIGTLEASLEERIQELEALQDVQDPPIGPLELVLNLDELCGGDRLEWTAACLQEWTKADVSQRLSEVGFEGDTELEAEFYTRVRIRLDVCRSEGTALICPHFVMLFVSLGPSPGGPVLFNFNTALDILVVNINGWFFYGGFLIYVFNNVSGAAGEAQFLQWEITLLRERPA